MRQSYLADRAEQIRLSNLPFFVVTGAVVHYDGYKRYKLCNCVEDGRQLVETWDSSKSM